MAKSGRAARGSIYATIALACTALPSAIPLTVPGLPLGIFLYEVPLIIAVALSLGRRPQGGVIAFGLVTIWGLALGIHQHHPHRQVINDGRNLADMLCFAFIVYANYPDPRLRAGAIRLIRPLLWISAAATLAASAHAFTLQGRSLTASLTSTTQGADRLITSASWLGLIVGCIVLSLWASGNLRSRVAMSYLMPSVLLMFLSFSRNNLIAIAVTLAWTLIALHSARAVLYLVIRGTIVALFIGVFLVLLPALPGHGWLSEQVSGFETRVIGGLSSTAIANDNSAQYRLQEDHLIWPAIDQHPIQGAGFGAAYKDATGRSGSFTATRGPYYAHNFYNWILFKTGVLGLFGFILFAVFPVLWSLSTTRPDVVAVAATVVGLLAVCFVAPLPIGTPTGALFGAVVGLLSAMLKHRYLTAMEGVPARARGQRGDRDTRAVQLHG